MLSVLIPFSGIDAETYPCDIIGPYFYEDDLLTEPLSIEGGRASATDKPGLGVELNEDHEDIANPTRVLKIDGEIGDKKLYDPRGYLKKAEQGLCNRLKQACDDLLSTGKTIFGKA